MHDVLGCSINCIRDEFASKGNLTILISCDGPRNNRISVCIRRGFAICLFQCFIPDQIGKIFRGCITFWIL